MQNLQPPLRAFLTTLREEAFIDIKSGYLDSGASAKQTKPVETMAKETNAKSLKKKKSVGVFEAGVGCAPGGNLNPGGKAVFAKLMEKFFHLQCSQQENKIIT